MKEPQQTVLVVDDDSASRSYLADLIRYAGHRVVEAGDGEEGLAAALREKPDLVIADILMPRMDGYELVRRLGEASDGPDSAFVFYSANYLEDEARDLARAVGVSHVLTKPAEPERILEVIEDVLGSPRPIRPSPPPAPEFREEHLRVMTDKLAQKVRELEEANRHRQALLAHVVSAQEEERKRIAGDIHDDSIQTITALGLRLGVIREDPTRADAETFAELEATVEGAIGRLRNLIFELHPPALDHHGLGAALRAYVRDSRPEVEWRFTVTDSLPNQPSLETRMLLYRIAQEALANIRKHAGATTVAVVIEEHDKGVSMRITDDGVGFSPETAPREAGHMGLDSMLERADIAGGRLELKSEHGSGTTISVWVPPDRPGAAGPGAPERPATASLIGSRGHP